MTAPARTCASHGPAQSQQIEPAANARVAQVVCGVVALLAIAVVYMVIVSNQVSSGKQELADLRTDIVAAEQQAAKLKPYADFAQATIARREAVKTVAGARFGWDRTLNQLARVAPGDVWLTSAKGTVSTLTTVKGGSSGGSSLRAALPGPALELVGCGKRESDVPKYMDRLYSMSGVDEVGFSSTKRADKRKAAGSAGAAGDTACAAVPGATAFSLVSYFKQSPALAAAAAAAATPGTVPAPAAAPTTKTPAPAATPAPANQTAATGTEGKK